MRTPAPLGNNVFKLLFALLLILISSCGEESGDKEVGLCRIYNGYDDQTILLLDNVTLKECRDRAYSIDGGSNWIFFEWDAG